MSTTMFGPLSAVFWFCVMLVEPVAFEVIVCFWSSGPEAQDPPELELAFCTVLPPDAEF
jgi:hypothetical protein